MTGDTAVPDAKNQLARQLREAHDFAQAGRAEFAVAAFEQARRMAVSLCDPKWLARRMADDRRQMRAEREAFSTRFAAGPNGKGRPLLVFADSLGLPRPERGVTAESVKETYSWWLGEGAFDRKVTPVCQRFFTSADVLSDLLADETLGRDGDTLIHVGLNDCAARMFLPEERLAIGYFDEAIQKSVVGFARIYRRDILRLTPTRHYVAIDDFRANLTAVGKVLASRGNGKVIFSTIILPPEKFWPATPGINWNFGRYNLAIMDVAHALGAKIFDADRVMWEAFPRSPLLGDGMHLSGYGHQLFANRVSKI